MENIRSLSIIAHIDHDKSTLSDRITQICDDLSNREMGAQILDSMDLERERGIITEAQSVTLNFKTSDGKTYQPNFVDTPGHVGFSYEISRSLAACESALLVVDVGQDVEAQTLANRYTVVEMGLRVIPVLNRIDLLTADPEHVAEEVKGIVGIGTTDAARCPAKTGIGITDVFERLVRDIPSPEGDPESPLQALIIDSWFDSYLDVVSLVRIKNGAICKGDRIKVVSTGQVYNADRLGVFMPKQVDRAELKRGEIGWLVCAIKDILGAPIDDILMQARNPADKPLPGFKKIKPQVYAGLFSVGFNDYENLHDTLGKLSLNDASLFYEPESSTAPGFDFRCGFPGLLHTEIIQERLECEYDLDLIIVAPTAVYKVGTTIKEAIYIDSSSKLPPLNGIYELCEPIAGCCMLLPQAYLGNVITPCIKEHGVQTNMVHHGNQMALTYEIPMVEAVLDFFDRLKSTSRGCVSPDYNFEHPQVSDTVRVDVLINNEHVDTLAPIAHRDNSQSHGRELVERTKDLIPRQQFDIAIQVAIGTHIITRSTVKRLYKNILAKCYGGDISRKKKLLQRQKGGKKRMKQIGSVRLLQEAFLAILHVGKDSEQS